MVPVVMYLHPLEVIKISKIPTLYSRNPVIAGSEDEKETYVAIAHHRPLKVEPSSTVLRYVRVRMPPSERLLGFYHERLVKK
jgi:hypothetical protein